MNSKNLDAATLRKLLHYNPDTGIFTWRTRALRHFASQGIWKSWNTKYAGAAAGSKTGKKGAEYISIGISPKRYYAHRLAFLYVNGAWPVNQVDHRDCNRLNNQWSNLRKATANQNQWNSRTRLDNATGFKGVTIYKGLYRAHIKVFNQQKFLGYFETPEKAATAYSEAAHREFGKFARVS